MKKYKVKTIELGVQSTNNYILKKTKRGHTYEEVKKASKLIRRYGFTLAGEDSMIRVCTEKYGSTAFTIRDGEKEYHLTAVVYEDEGGYPQLKIIPEE